MELQHQNPNRESKERIGAFKALAISMALLLSVWAAGVRAESRIAFDPHLDSRSESQAITHRNTRAASPFQIFESALRQNWTSTELSSYDALAGGLIDLLDYVWRGIAAETIEELIDSIHRESTRFNRHFHFGGWVNADPEEDCMDTRNEVLVRDAVAGTEIKFKGPRSCMVIRAKWKDPYTGRYFKLASAVQVDHVVPLKHAYYTGGFQWDPARRCHYANFLENHYHLRTVSGHENMSKGERAPDRYMPPNESYQCQYLNEWMRIKVVWGLAITRSEANAIYHHLLAAGCSEETRLASRAELEREHLASLQPIEKCRRFADRVRELQ